MPNLSANLSQLRSQHLDLQHCCSGFNCPPGHWSINWLIDITMKWRFVTFFGKLRLLANKVHPGSRHNSSCLTGMPVDCPKVRYSDTAVCVVSWQGKDCPYYGLHSVYTCHDDHGKRMSQSHIHVLLQCITKWHHWTYCMTQQLYSLMCLATAAIWYTLQHLPQKVSDVALCALFGHWHWSMHMHLLVYTKHWSQ